MSVALSSDTAVSVTIDGRTVAVPAGASVLARRETRAS